MGSGFKLLLIYGAQNVYLSGNPQITFFKLAYKRHTNFTIRPVEQKFEGNVKLGSKNTIILSKNGDLLSQCYIKTTLSPGTSSGVSHFIRSEVGHRLIDYIELEIGEQRIDKHYGVWYSIWNQLVLQGGKQDGYDRMIGNVSELITDTTVEKNDYDLYIPLHFFFCRHSGLALPLIAIQYNEVKLTVKFQTYEKIAYADTWSILPSIKDTSMINNYIFLDMEERKLFLEKDHEYLIEQLQYSGEEKLIRKKSIVDLDFYHPVKELFWITQDDSILEDDLLDFLDNNYNNPTELANIQFNGNDRMREKEGRYFNIIQPYQYHTKIPTTEGINIYSFCLKPEEPNPTGSCNFSMIDRATLNITLTDTSVSSGNIILKVYALNYNVLEIKKGFGNLLFSN
jgi:hypothetical protein